MKTKLHHWLIACTLILGLYACSEPTKTPENTQNKFASPSESVNQPNCSPCEATSRDTTNCAGDRLVMDSCALAWEAKWAESAKLDGLNAGDSTLLLSKTKLATLESACTTCPGKRVYFGRVKRSGEIRLALMIVNVKTSSCDDDYTVPKGEKQPVLAFFRNTDGTMKEEFVSKDSAKVWSEHFSAEFYGGDNPKFLRVHSYTFMSSKIKETAGKSEAHLRFRFALHKVQKHDDCTLPYEFGTQTEGQVIDLVVRPDKVNEDEGKSEYLDFARPCPKLCGSSML